MALGVTILIVVVIAASIWALLGRKHAIDKLPGPPALPFFGNALSYFTDAEQVLLTMHKFSMTYWPLYRIWMGTIPVISPLGPQEVEVIMSSSQHITKSHDYKFVGDWLGEGLLTSGGSKWHSRRKMLTPAFHFSILEQFVPVFSEKTKILLRRLNAYVGNPDGVDVVPLITRCALDIICQTAMGTSIDAQEDTESKYVSEIYEVNDYFMVRMLSPWLHPDWIFNITPSGRRTKKLIASLHAFTDNIIKERREEIKKSGYRDDKNAEDDEFGVRRKKAAFLDLLLRVSENDPSMTDADIREEVDTFMFEGHDTTAMAMSWATYFLSCYPKVQERCVAELSEIFEGSDRDPTMADLGAMKYLERVIKETLRLRPSVYLIARKIDKTCKIGKNEFPPGTVVHVNIFSIHRNAEIFPEPEKFDPERFSPDNAQGRHPYSYIPFSAGPRNCIGQKFAMLEMKNLLSTLLRHFRLESIDPERHYLFNPDLILRPKFGLQTKIFPRGKMP